MLAMGFFSLRGSQLLYLKDSTVTPPLRDFQQWTVYQLPFPDLLLPFFFQHIFEKGQFKCLERRAEMLLHQDS